MLQRGEAARDGTLRLLGSDFRLIERGGVDQFADGFGLGKIDAAIEIGAQSELARFGGAGTARDRLLDAIPQNYGRAMAGDFDYVFRSVGMGRGVEGDNDAIDAAHQGTQMGAPRFKRDAGD